MWSIGRGVGVGVTGTIGVTVGDGVGVTLGVGVILGLGVGGASIVIISRPVLYIQPVHTDPNCPLYHLSSPVTSCRYCQLVVVV